MRKIIGILLLNLAALTLMADGKIFKRNSTYIGDCMVTWKDGKLYKGNSTYIGDCILTFADLPSPALIAWITFFFVRGFF